MTDRREFWGDLDFRETIVTPVDILHDLAEGLGPRTNFLVTAAVESRRRDRNFAYNFNFVVPILETYVYTLFTIEHGVSAYPVVIKGIRDGEGNAIRCDSQESFETALQEILSSEATRNVIQNLAAHARSLQLTEDMDDLFFPLNRYVSRPDSDENVVIDVRADALAETANDVLIEISAMLQRNFEFIYVRVHPESRRRANRVVELAVQGLPRVQRNSHRWVCNRDQPQSELTLSPFWTDGDYSCST